MADEVSDWDFFVSYTQADRTWAEWISWSLEENGYRVLVQAWDFVPGTNWSGSEDGTVRVWDLYANRTFSAPDVVVGMAFSPDGRRLASALVDNTVRLWNVDTGEPDGAPLTGHTDALADVAWSPDGHRLASAGDDNTVRLWNADTGQPVGAPLTGHTAWLTSVEFSPDGHRLATGGDDQHGAVVERR